jgi:hypothetical protein
MIQNCFKKQQKCNKLVNTYTQFIYVNRGLPIKFRGRLGANKKTFLIIAEI